VALNSAALAVPIVASSGMMTIRHVSNASTHGDFEATWTSVQPGITYSWSPTTGLSHPDSMNTLLEVPSAATTYTLTVTAPGTCSFVDQVVVTPAPLVVNAGPDVSMYCGDSVSLGDETTTVVNMPASGFSREPSGVFYDSGGAGGNYGTNENRTFTIRPAGAGRVFLRFFAVTGTDVDDRITLYDGPDERSPILYGPGTISGLSTATAYIANSGVMTVRFQSDASSTYAGWYAEWTSETRGDYSYVWTPGYGLSDPHERYPRVSVLDGDVRTYRLTITGPNGCTAWDEITVTGLGYTVDAGPGASQSCGDSVTIGLPVASVNMHNGTTFMPYGNFYDSGGPASNYLATDNFIYTIRPLGATSVTLNFSARAGDSGDQLTIFDGPDINSPIITGPVGVNAIATATNFTASSGVMTIRFTNDGDATAGAGWTAAWTSTPLVGNAFYQWSPTTGLANPNAPRTRVLADVTTTYTLSIVTPAGCSPVSDEVTVTVNPHPADLDLTDRVICPGNTVVLDAAGSAARYAWQVRRADAEVAGYTYTPVTDTLPNANFTASSTNGTNHPYTARLNQTGGWRAGTAAVGQWLRVDLGAVLPVTQVATQKYTIDATRYTTSYRLQYSLDDATWLDYTENGTTRVFTGNANNNNVVTHELAEPVVARYVRFVVAGYASAPTLRVEVYTSPELRNSTLEVNKPGEYRVYGMAAGCSSAQPGIIRVTDGGANGYHYRTVADGDWTDLNIWEVLNDATGLWEPATSFVGCSSLSYPTSRSRTITVRDSVVYSVSIPEGIDETTVTADGTIFVPLGRSLYIVDSSAAVTTRDEDIWNAGRIVVEGDLVVRGAGLLFNEDLSTVAYVRAGQQTMWDGKYGRLEIRNGATKLVSGIHSRANTEVQFFQGHIEHGPYNFSLANAAVITGAAWNTGWFVTNGSGKLIKERLGPAGTHAGFSFPVGHATTSYNEAILTNTGLTDTFAVRVAGVFEYDVVYNTDLPVFNNSVNRTWHIDESRVGGSSVAMRLHWLSSHENPGYDRNLTRRVHFGAPVGWDYRSATASADGLGTPADPWYHEVGGLTEFSPYTESSDAILDASRLLLSGSLVGEDGHLQWRSQPSPDAVFFELERAEDNGQFGLAGTLAHVPGQQSYTLVDARLPLANSYQYRVRRYHADGSQVMSNTIWLGQGARQRVVLYPNPVAQGRATTLGVEVQRPARVEVRIYNNLGQEVFQLPVQQVPAGAWYYALPTEKLAAGIYYVNTSIDGRPYQNRLVVLE
ncbi:MAG: discoidin domain-containing protein, partial [Bacteroidetes bacterium]|nr:discoidin domain-containing protein [Bacteroidota bacterium]